MLRYPLLFRVHIHRFQCILRVAQQQSHNPDTALPSSGSPRVGFAVLSGTISVLRLPSAFPPHLVAFVQRYHRPPTSFVSPDPIPGGESGSGLDVYGPSPMVTHIPDSPGGAFRASSPRRRLYPPACKPYGLEAEPEARFLGSPLVPLPRSPTPAAPLAPCHPGAQVSPPQVRPRRPQR